MNKPQLNRRFVRLSSMVTTVGRHWELQVVALLKAVWWGMHLVSLLSADALVISAIAQFYVQVYF